LTWFDRNGKALGTFGAPEDFSQVALSPDGKTLAASFYDAQGQDVYTYDLSHDLPQGSPTRFTFDPARDDFPMWAPDGRSIVFNSVRKGHWDLYRKSADGSGAEEVLYADEKEKYPNSFSPDGKLLLFAAVGTANSAYWALPLTPESSAAPLKPVPFLPGSSLRWGKFSPDGRWVAYVLGEQPGVVYVSSFSHRGGTHQISANGGIKPLWRRDGKEIFYLSPGGRLMATEVRISGETVEVGSTHALLGGIPLGNGYAYDVSADGQRILAAVARDQKSSEPITLVQNWAAGLKK
jgi:Tol biopolymer transport system component